MATNWTMVDAFEVIKKNEDRAAVADIVKRFPLASRAMILASTNEGAEEIVKGLPTYVTVRKIENVLKGEIEDDEVEEVEEKKPAKKDKKAAKKKAPAIEKMRERRPEAYVFRNIARNSERVWVPGLGAKLIRCYKERMLLSQAGEERV